MSWKPGNYSLAETKCQSSDFRIKAKINNGWNSLSIDATGLSGGLTLLWKKKIKCTTKETTNRYIIADITLGINQNKWTWLMYLEALIENLIPIGSDHAPIILIYQQKQFLLHPFRFEWMWTQGERCKEQIEKDWNRTYQRTKLEKVQRDLRRLPYTLKRWN